MVHFYITCVLAIPYQEELEKKRSGKQKGEKKPLEESTDVLMVGKPKFSCHLEYCLMPHVKYDVDVVCWGKCAKVYSADGVRAVRTVISKDLCWVAFSVTHSFALLNQHLESLYNEVITFKLWPTHTKMAQRAKSDSPKMFYTREASVQIPFEQVFETPPDDSTDNDFVYTNDFTVGELISALNPVLYPEHKENVLELIRKDEDQKNRTENEQLDNTQEKIEPKPKKGKSTVKGLKGKGKVGKSDESLEMSLNGEAFFTGQKQQKCELREGSPQVYSLIALMTAKDLLTAKQIANYNPIVIHVDKLKGLPATLLNDHGITSIYTKYQILDKFSSESAHKPTETNIAFDEMHVILTNNFSKISLLQFLQTGMLDIEIHGVQQPQPRLACPSIFGQDSLDKYIGSKNVSYFHRDKIRDLVQQIHNDTPSSLPLAVVRINLSSLLQGCNILEITQPVKVWNSRRDNETVSINPLIINNHYPDNIPSANPLTDALLCESRTRLKVSVKVGSSMSPLIRQALVSPNIFNRIFTVLYDMDLATNIINDIYSINQPLLGKSIVVPNYTKAFKLLLNEDFQLSEELRTYLLMENNYKEDETFAANCTAEEDDDNGSPSYHQLTLTGFVIDSFDKIIIYVEGPMNSKFQEVWNSLMGLTRYQGRVMYNSELVFEERKYLDFLVYGGLYIITLCETLDAKLIQKNNFQEGYIPESCWRTLMKLDLLLKARTMQSAVCNNLFPSIKDLISLNLEFGVPMHVSEEDEIKDEEQRKHSNSVISFENYYEISTTEL